jgi:hypothetical protein
VVQTGFWWGGLSEWNQIEDPSRQKENYIKTDIREVGWGGMEGIDLAQVKTGGGHFAVMNLRFP